MDFDKFIHVINQFVKTEYSHLNLKNLEGISFTSNFAEDVVEFQQAHNLQVGFTNGDDGIAVAKVIDHVLNGEVYRRIFINSDIFFGMAHQNINTALNLLIHELGHIHDDNNKSLIFNENEMKIEHYADLKNILCTISNITWSEYAADYIAAGLAELELIDNRKNHVQALIKSVKCSVDSALYEYNYHRINKYQLFVTLQETTHLLLKIAANYLGMMHGKNLETTDLSIIFGKSYFIPVFDQLATELKSMMDRFPEWKSIEEFKNLSNIILFLWECLGVQIKYDNEDIEVKVITPSPPV